MARRLAALMSIAACGLAGAGARADAAKEVQGLVVVTGPGPTVKSTYPATGGAVPGGIVILKVVFDQPMTPQAWAYGHSPEGDFPDCLADPRLLGDQRTYVLLCRVSPSRTYAVEINAAPRFANENGRSAKAYTLKFTTGADLVTSLHDALLGAGLKDEDDPIMTWRDTGQGVSQSAEPP
jgi:hypothetical protein